MIDESKARPPAGEQLFTRPDTPLQPRTSEPDRFRCAVCRRKLETWEAAVKGQPGLCDTCARGSPQR